MGAASECLRELGKVYLQSTELNCFSRLFAQVIGPCTARLNHVRVALMARPDQDHWRCSCESNLAAWS